MGHSRGRCLILSSVSCIAVSGLLVAACGGSAQPPAPAGASARIEQRRSALTTDVAVTLIDGWGNPVANESVEALDTNGDVINSGATNAAGHVTLAVDGQGTYVFRVFYHWAPYKSAACNVPAGCTSATVKIEKPVAVAVSDGYGVPVAGQGVTAFDAEENWTAEETTNSAGVATFYLSPPGPYFFRAVAGNMYFDTPLDCGIPGCVSASIAVTKVRVTVTGTNGVPAAGLGVSVVDTNGNEINWFDTDAQGHADVGVPAGAYKFRVVVNGDYIESGADGHCAVPGCRTATITVPACAGQADGTACDDGDPCTTADVCNGGVCQGPTAFTCVSPDSCQEAGTCDSGKASPPPPSTEGLIGWWKLDGNGFDALGEHDLTIEGNVVPAPGRFGLGMKFDGTSCMTTPDWTDAGMTGANGVTMMAWVNIADDFPCPTTTAILGKGFDYSMGAWCPEPSDTAPAFTGNVRPAGAWTWGYPGGLGPLVPNHWSLVALSWDHHDIRLYVNGKAWISYQNVGEFADIDSTFAIGCMISRYFTGEDRIAHFAGTIDEAMLWRRLLSDAEIAAYWTASDPCIHPPHGDGTSCTDNNLCTTGDTCHSGVCRGDTPVTCTAPDSCHDAAACLWWAGCYYAPPKPDGAACNDGQTCTQGETCQAGTCAAPSNTP
ncbi:MAG TPA: LamG-like jellyroll fold domain-containing protein, partial [Polyangia bacterium]|nr:LamG-like jellyroll fold domain-containing protein [Polyangia bacterium]